MSNPAQSATLSVAESGRNGCAGDTPGETWPWVEEDPADQFSALRGAVTGALLGIALWGGAIFALAGVIRH